MEATDPLPTASYDFDEPEHDHYDQEEEDFPDPVDFAKIDEATIDRIIRKRSSSRTKETTIIFKPDHQGQMKMEMYKQTR